MLSTNTRNILSAISLESRKIYEYGGLSFSYMHGNCFPLTIGNRARKSKLEAEKNTSLYPDEIEKICEFIDIALDNSGSDSVSPETRIKVSSFLEALESDFKGLPIGILSCESESASSHLELLVLEKNYYHLINLCWSPS